LVASPEKFHRARVECVVFKDQFRALLRRQAFLDERHIYILVAAIKFVADDCVADVREMDSDLMFASGARENFQEREIFSVARKSFLDKKFRLRSRAVFTHAIFEGDNAVFIFAERRVNHAGIFRNVAVDDCQIFFLDGARFENFSEFAGSFGIFCDQNDAAGFAVEAVD
jgi:hypothetical protein